MHIHSIFNIDMAIEPEKGGKLAHERLQSALPVRAKTRRQPSRLMGPQGFLAEQINRIERCLGIHWIYCKMNTQRQENHYAYLCTRGALQPLARNVCYV